MTHASPAILLVEDDESLRVALGDNLVEAGYAVEAAATGEAARAALERGGFALVILDIMLPDTDGYTLCRELRAAGRDMRVLMLTARSLEEDLVRGFEAGADDYVAKPYRLAEVLARVKALLRRRVDVPTPRLRFGAWTLDAASRTVAGVDGAPLELTRKEFDLLAYLLEHRGRALSRQEILDAVWGVDVIVDGRTIDNFVSSLKRKLAWSPRAGFRIATVRGVGYRMEVAETVAG